MHFRRAAHDRATSIQMAAQHGLEHGSLVDNELRPKVNTGGREGQGLAGGGSGGTCVGRAART